MSDRPVLTAAEVARRLGGTLEGDGSCVIRDVGTLDRADAETLSWVGSPEFTAKAAASQAGVVLAPPGCALPPDRTVIRVADPDAAVSEVLAYLAPPVDRIPVGIHEAATVSADAVVEGAGIGAHVTVGTGAEVGPGTQLFPGVYVGSKAKIGRDCVLWPNVVVRERVQIGDRVVIHPNATIGADGYSYLQRDGRHQKIPQIGTVIIEDDVEIGANTTIDRARSGATRIGCGTKIDNLVMIGHNVEIGEHGLIVGQCGMGGSSSIGHHVFLGGQAGIVDHVHIGNGVQVAGKSIVSHSVPDGQTVRGIPAVPNRQFVREQASLRKLPDWMKRLGEWTKRIEQLEAKHNDKS